MKLAYPVAEEGYTGNIMAFTGSNREAFSWLRDHGFVGVELLVRDPDKVDVAHIDKLLSEFNLSIAAIGTNPMQALDKLFLVHPDEENRREARKRCSDLISLCSYYGASALIGKYRGTISNAPGCTKDDMERVLSDITEEAHSLGVPLLVEPQNSTNINNINTIAEGLDWISRMGEGAGLLADIYHMGITEISIKESLLSSLNNIGFVHMSDSERKIPGEGNLPLADIIKNIEESGYDKYISFEIKQQPDSKTASAKSSQFMYNHMNS